MYNPYKHLPNINEILKDSTTNTPANAKPKPLSELKKLCDATNDLKWVDKCMHNLPAYIQMKEENYKGTIKFDPRYAENEAFKEEVMKKTFNSYNLVKHRDEKVLTTSLLACTNYYYTECVKNQH
jgi:hypothetical protein